VATDPPLTPEEQILLELREMRKALADITLRDLKGNSEVLSAIEALGASLTNERLQRRRIEYEEAMSRARIKQKLVSEAEGDTTQRIRALVRKEMTKDKINWPEMFRKTILPNIVTVVLTVVTLSLLAALVPGFAQALIRAFSQGVTP
jgi:Fe2+ transport system protein B